MRPRVWQAAKRAKQSDSGKACMSDRVAGVLQEKLGETFSSRRTDGGVGSKPGIDGWDLSRDGGRDQKTKKKGKSR